MANAVEGLKLKVLQSRIKWAGRVLLEQLGEEDETMLAEQEWPLKSGRMFYACVTTGLLFDKQSGDCKQSSRIRLILDSVVEQPCSARDYMKWVQARILSAPRDITIKRGPKPKGSVVPREQWDNDDADY